MNRNTYQIPRRTFLKGAGVSLAVPFLDIMSPAVSYAKAKAVAAPVRFRNRPAWRQRESAAVGAAHGDSKALAQ